MKKKISYFFYIFGILAVESSMASLSANPKDILPQGEHRDLVAGHCGGCHSLALVAQNRLSKAEWLKTIRWMQKNHNLWTFPPETEEKILNYLSTKLGVSAQRYGMGDLRPKVFNPLP